MIEITSHRVDGNSCNGKIKIKAIGHPGPGGAHLSYCMEIPYQELEGGNRIALHQFISINFQSGDPANGVNGFTNESLLAVLALGESLDGYSCQHDEGDLGLGAIVEDVNSGLDDIKDEQQEKLDNMPESLQQAPTGELLQTRIDNIESAIGDLDSIDTTFDSEMKSEKGAIEDAIAEAAEARFEEVIQEIRDAIDNAGSE